MESIQVKEKLEEKSLSKIVSVLKNGGLIIYPTDTAYGIGALCTSEDGIDKLYSYKGRRGGKPVSIAVLDRKMAEKYVVLNSGARELYNRLLPGAFTIISKLRKKKREQRSFKLIAPTGTLGIRIPDNTLVLQIVNALKQGITATSANISGGKTPYKVSDVLENLTENQKAKIGIILDAGPLPKKDTSTIIDTTVTPIKVLRGDFNVLKNRDSRFISKSQHFTSLKQYGAKVQKRELIWHYIDADKSSKIGKVFFQDIKDYYQRSSSNCSNKNLPLCLLITGAMGAGKTTLVQVLAKRLGISSNVISPSYIFERQYEIHLSKDDIFANFLKLFHYDLWRLDLEKIDLEDNLAELMIHNLGMGLALEDQNIIAIEWPEKIVGLQRYLENLPAIVMDINIEVKEQGERILRYCL